MFGFSKHPSSSTPWSCSALNVFAKTTSVTRAHSSTEWSPSHKTSGSTIGTSFSDWQMVAYLHNVCAQ